MLNKIIALCLFVCFLQTGKLAAQEASVFNRPVSIHLPADSLIKVLLKLQSKTKSGFSFDADLLRKYRTKAITVTQTPLRLVLEKVFTDIPLTFTLVGNDIVITPIKPVIYTLNGHVRDKASGEAIIGATVFIPALQAGILTNQYGYYAISIPAGKQEIRISSLGYETETVTLNLDSEHKLEAELSALANTLAEVNIRQNLTPNPLLLNMQNFRPAQLSHTAYYAGETDAVKALQMQSGIKAISEGSSGLFIRGGNSDQNLILLDEAVIYNPSHLYGLVSVFNPDAINNLQVYKDYMPANYGGRLSAVIENRMAEGNNKAYHLSGGISLMSARLAAEGPIVKEKGSFIVAFRRSLLDVFHNKFKLFNPSSVYYDLNAKANYKLNSNNSLFYSLYGGKDYLLSENSFSNNWGNITSTLRWNHLFNARLFLNVSAIYSNYSNLLDLNSDTLSSKSQWNTGVKDLTLKTDYTYYANSRNLIKFGLTSTYHRFTPGETYKPVSSEFDIAGDRSLESAAYYNQQMYMGNFALNYGLRIGIFKNAEQQLNVFDANGNRVDQEDHKTFINPEPRIHISYLLSPKQSFFLTYNRNYQYLQLIQNSTLAFSSLEPWIPASGTIKPQHADHFSAGYKFAPNTFSLLVNAYLKKMYHQLDLMGHAQIIQNPDIRNQLKAGQSNAYGVEIEINKTEGKFTGVLAYNYSRVFRTIQGINNGNRFAANYDIPHELKFTATYNFNSKLSLQSFFTYATGRPLTLPTGYYQHDGINVPIFENRNTSRFPDFSRLDLSAQYKMESRLSRKRNLSSTLSVGTYNLYNRKNPLYYHLNTNPADPQKSVLEYAFGFYPWVAYSFKI